MKILYLIEEIDRGGKERRMTELIKGLSEHGGDIEIHLALSRTSIAYAEIIDLPIVIHYLSGGSGFKLILQYYRLFRKIQPDIVHTWSFKTSFYAALLKSKAGSYKLISGFIGDTFGFSRKMGILAKLLVFRQSDAIISNSKAGLKAYKVPKKKGWVIYNGFAPTRIVPTRTGLLKSIGVNTPYTVVMLANVTPFKDYQLFLNVAHSIISTRDDVTFISIGKISQQYHVLADPYINNKHPKIKFLGVRTDVSELIRECDLGVLCTYTEGISNAIIEIMAHGIPVITNDLNGGTREIISSNEDGIICEGDRIIEKINYLLNNVEIRCKMGDRAKQKVLNNFTLAGMISEYQKLYLL